MHSRLGRHLWWYARGRGRELAFWSAWIVGAPGAEEWADDRRARLDPEAPIVDPLVRAEIARVGTGRVSILDVGAGPITNLGYRYPGKELTIVPIDPLADHYSRLLRRAGLEPPIRTIRVAGETLLGYFPPSAFDIAHAVNSLDHSADPLLIVENMLQVVRPGGVVLLRHHHNEGEHERYEGLHQWNFDCEEGRLIFWNNARRVDVTGALCKRARTEAWILEDEILVRITRLKTDSALADSSV
jgi:SAM-dependent methyltransferase